ncbi:MAG: MFS transporter [Longispora sp.]|nr:MFS transporter [Longispora sp. (in: high G+C Gram-positive bacteria)]
MSRKGGQPNPWIGLAGLCTAAGLVWLAFAELAIALPTIASELHVDLTDLQWANNAFSLACGALVLAAGRISDLYGRKRVLLLGVVIFGVFSLVTAFFSGLVGLIAGRALMGVGAALILPSTLAIIPQLFTREQQPKAFGAWMAVSWVGQAAGPAVGGALTSLLGWRSVFWSGAVFAVAAFFLIHGYTTESRDESAPHGINAAGLLTSAGAALCLLYGFTEGQETGFDDPLIIGLLVAAVVLAVVFVLIERRVHNPLVEFRLFRARDFDGALTANLVMNMVFAGLSFLLALYLQDVRGYSALEAGLLLFPSTVTILLLNPVGYRVSSRFGPRSPVVWGLVLLGLGSILAGILSTNSSYWLLMSGLLVLGAGLGLLSVPLSDTAVAGPPPELAGMASGLFKMGSMLGGAIGVAIFSAIAKVISSNRGEQAAQAAGLSQDEINQLGGALSGSDVSQDILDTLSPQLRDSIIAAYQQDYVSGVAGSIKIAGLFTLVAAIALVAIWPRNSHKSTA